MTARADYTAMIEAADDWGPADDDERRWFLAGWRDEADRRPNENRPPEETVAAVCAYYSGVIAARSEAA